jgi:hypothetical protein
MLLGLFALLSAVVSGYSISTPDVRLLARADPSETTVLNYILSIKYTSAAFYNTALKRFPASSFNGAGLTASVRGRYQQMADHEASQAEKLKKIIGNSAVTTCTYGFPFNTTIQFAALSDDIETASSAALLGAIGSLRNPDTIVLVSSMLASSARHAAWASAVVNAYTPWSSAYETTLSMNQGWSYFATYVTKCPSTNPNLGLKVFSPLSASLFDKPAQGNAFKVDPNSKGNEDGSGTLGLSWEDHSNNIARRAPPAPTPPPPASSSSAAVSVSVSAAPSSVSPGAMPRPSAGTPLYVAIFSDLSTVQYVQIKPDNTVSLPAGLVGTVYVVVTTSSNAVSDDNIVAGPAVVQFPLAPSQTQS